MESKIQEGQYCHVNEINGYRNGYVKKTYDDYFIIITGKKDYRYAINEKNKGIIFFYRNGKPVILSFLRKLMIILSK